MNSNETDVKNHSISTVLLIFSGGLAVVSLLNIFPWGIIQFIPNRLSLLQGIELIIGGGALFWLLLLSWFYKNYTYWRNSKKLMESNSLKDQVIPFIPYLQKFKGLKQIDFRILKEDSAKIILKNPIFSIIRHKGHLQKVVIFPFHLWNRFSKHPNALAAVLVHETAHAENKDMQRLLGMQHLLIIAAGLTGICLFLTVIQSIFTDITSSNWEWAALQASLVGKNYLFFSLVFITLTVLLVQSLESWREALADEEAIKICGENALREAEELLRIEEDNEQKYLQRYVYSLTSREIILLGFLVNTIADYGIGQLAYLQRFIVKSIAYQEFYAILTEFLLSVLMYLGFYIVLVVIGQDPYAKNTSLLKRLGKNAWLLVLGAVLGHLLLQIVPLLVTSIAMPENYDYVLRHDAKPLLLAGIAGAITGSAAAALLAVVGAWLGVCAQRRWLGILPGVVWSTFAIGESRWIPGLFEGGLAIWVTAMMCLLLIFSQRANLGWKILQGSTGWLALLIILSLFHGLGYGDINYFAVSSSKACQKTEAANSQAALQYCQRAARRSSLHPNGWMQLARLLATQNQLQEAVEAAERAIEAPYNSAWESKFEALTLAGDLRLQLRTEKDLQLAEQHYRHAEQLWRQNSRLSRDKVATLLYNYGCLKIIRNEDRLVALTYLIEALALKRELASAIKADEDLKALWSLSQSPLHRSDIEQLLKLSPVSAPALQEIAQQQQIDEHGMLWFLVQIMKASLSGNPS
ncbi:MAG: M48 family metalloprotease [Candidatus Competibacteraceae bacterium]